MSRLRSSSNQPHTFALSLRYLCFTCRHPLNHRTFLSNSYQRQRLGRLLLYGACGTALIVRLMYCASLPVNTGDLMRHLLYGKLVLTHGLWIGGLPLAEVSHRFQRMPWSEQPYAYPAIALYFFTAVAAVHSSLFAGKLILTLIEALNAFLVFRITRDRVCAALYWVAPTSIWWVSKEGQFEPLQNAFALFAIFLLPRNVAAAWAMLALAIQVKLTAICLVPYFIWHTPRSMKHITTALAAIAVSALPTFILQLQFPHLQVVFLNSVPYRFNPFFWDWRSTEAFTWMWVWMRVLLQVASWLFLGLLIFWAVCRRMGVECIPAIGYMLLLKFFPRTQFWYVTLLPSFLVLIKSTFHRRVAFVAYLALDVYAFAQMFLGGFGAVTKVNLLVGSAVQPVEILLP